VILVDNRIGSKDLLSSLPERLNPQTATLPYGDVSFVGKGPNGKLFNVGVEIKTISDSLDSFTSKRFVADQLPGLLECYDRVYYLLEGTFTRSDDGCLKLGKWVPVRRKVGEQLLQLGDRKWIWNRDSGVKYLQFKNYFTSISETKNVRIIQTIDREDTAYTLGCLYTWWQTPWEEHKTIKMSFYNDPDLFYVGTPSFEEQFAYILPGIGRDKISVVAEHFGSVYAAVTASEEEWVKLPGIGKKTAQKIHKRLRGI
jgi:ERCC4-type nuclease